MLRNFTSELLIRLMLVHCSLLAGHVQAGDYLNDVKPLLEAKCYACHGSLKSQGGLRLDTAVDLIKGGDSGPVVVAGKPEESLLIDVLTGEAGYQMPPASEGIPMSTDEIDRLRRWIAAGAPSPRNEARAADPTTWWSYQPIKRQPPPSVAESDWCRNPIDRFVQATREQTALPHATQADRETWLRRVYLDLIGLPPTRQQLKAFADDARPDAFERVVDDLLSRPEYGQRWGRHWMDIWRYSDWYGSRGINEIRYSQRHIWRWRDWIIDALNDDEGYDQMIRDMLAADESDFTEAERLAATGYLGRNWYKFDRDAWLFDTVERTSEALLGLTLRCCRCHDHKFDPISQVEYYQFRACFEPHDVRTDPVSAITAREKDATLGMVLSDGIPLVYDKEGNAPTYLFDRGDNRSPDKSRKLHPGVPQAFGGTFDVQPIDLPAEVWYPRLRADLRESMLRKMADAVHQAAAELDRNKKVLRQLREPGRQREQHGTSDETEKSQATTLTSEPFLLTDAFVTKNPSLWKISSGDWRFSEGKLRQSSVTQFATIVADRVLPLDFSVRLRYRTLEAGTYRSVGFSFDLQENGSSQDVYTSVNDRRTSVQAFHRTEGRQIYPTSGIVYTPLEIGKEISLEVRVVGTSLTIDVNGERKLDYTMPQARRNGKFALWVHEGAAEFLELQVASIEESEAVRRQRIDDASGAVKLAELKLRLAEARRNSMRMRIDAEVAKYLRVDPRGAEIPTLDYDEATRRMSRSAASATADVEVLEAELQIAEASDDGTQRQEAEDRLEKAIRKASDPLNEDYPAIGEQFPQVSTGRRLALAEWVTDRANPRTARVAVNHLWGRHFGQPIVATAENFGLNGRKPTHPRLLDWLADELMRNDWRMKPLHKLIVLSATYRMSSKASGETSAVASTIDPNNQWLWKMPQRRMEAEVVRDSTLFLANRLDRTFGGPEIVETEGDKIFRRSLYFRNTPNEKNVFMEIFDVADPNACYRRQQSIVPHQSLAMMNSRISRDARLVADRLKFDDDFINAAFETILSRPASTAEHERCRRFLQSHTSLLQQHPGPSFATPPITTKLPEEDPRQRAARKPCPRAAVTQRFCHHSIIADSPSCVTRRLEFVFFV
ncbi:MAG: PSD1 and planctomycete cytochrome C domain-containing protein [Pirellulaceae bacterium]